jgi:molybdenum cofactor cytidylyltransferase
VQAATIRQIATRLLQGAGIVVPRYQGQRGNPVGFAAKFTDDLLRLSGDQGARALFEKYPSDVEYIDTDDAGILIDIDTPEDLLRN